MYSIDNQSREAVYEQIVTQTERFVLMGLMKENQPMPSVRSLSMELSVNPNTIQKAYSELERRGVTYVVPGRGSFIAADAREKLSLAKHSLLSDIESLAGECSLAGIDKSLVYEAVDKGYSEKGGNEQ